MIDKSELVRRVEQLVAEAEDSPGRTSASSGLAPGDLEEQVHALRLLQGHVWPPKVERGRSLRGQLAWATKRVVRKASSWYVEPRWVVQQDFDVRAAEFATQTFNLLRVLELEVEMLRRNQLTLRMQLVANVERANEVQARLRNEAEEMVRRHREISDLLISRPMDESLRGEVEGLHREVASVLERLGAASSVGTSIDYVAFENHFRGDSEELAEIQRGYLKYFPGNEVVGKVLDVGCGRGEMLQLLRTEGFEAFGVDSDMGMIAECRNKGLDVVEDNALQLLDRLEDGSLKGVFCSQVVEHLLTSELQRFVQLSFEKLSPGGVLIIETINPRSSFALGEHFYADPSHIRPVHPETLRFLCAHAGFEQPQLVETSLHPMAALVDQISTDDQMGEAVGALLGKVFGFQDYAIIATK